MYFIKTRNHDGFYLDDDLVVVTSTGYFQNKVLINQDVSIEIESDAPKGQLFQELSTALFNNEMVKVLGIYSTFGSLLCGVYGTFDIEKFEVSHNLMNPQDNYVNIRLKNIKPCDFGPLTGELPEALIKAAKQLRVYDNFKGILQ